MWRIDTIRVLSEMEGYNLLSLSGVSLLVLKSLLIEVG